MAKISHEKWILVQLLKQCNEEELKAFNDKHGSIEALPNAYVWPETVKAKCYIKNRQEKMLNLLLGDAKPIWERENWLDEIHK